MCLLAFSLLLWRHMEVHTLVVVRKTRLVHLTRWHAQGMWVGRDTQQVHHHPGRYEGLQHWAQASLKWHTVERLWRRAYL